MMLRNINPRFSPERVSHADGETGTAAVGNPRHSDLTCNSGNQTDRGL